MSLAATIRLFSAAVSLLALTISLQPIVCAPAPVFRAPRVWVKPGRHIVEWTYLGEKMGLIVHLHKNGWATTSYKLSTGGQWFLDPKTGTLVIELADAQTNLEFDLAGGGGCQRDTALGLPVIHYKNLTIKPYPPERNR